MQGSNCRKHARAKQVLPGHGRSVLQLDRGGRYISTGNGTKVPAGCLWAECQHEGFAVAVILIVEDETQVRVLSESYLREQGHQTLSAATLEEALAVLGDSEEIDILFTDIELQGDIQAGLTVAQAATERRPGIQVLYTSCHAVTDGMKAMFVEGSAFLPKPYSVDQLQTILAVNFGIKPHPVPMPSLEAGIQPQGTLEPPHL
jgi:CheY-like chemotaxis protein